MPQRDLFARVDVRPDLAYANAERTAWFPAFLDYNNCRTHSVLGFRPSASRLGGNNLLTINTELTHKTSTIVLMGSPQPARRPLPPTALPSAKVLGAVTLLLSLHPLEGYFYLPTLPLLRAEFSASIEDAQWTLSAFVIGFGLTQLAWGALADRHGRRPILLSGLGLFLVAALGCLAAINIHQVIAWRLMQGAGAAAAGVCARALLRDLHHPSDAVRMLSIGFSGLSAVAIIGPVCGAALVDLRGARGSFELLAAIGFAALVLLALWMPETAPHFQFDRESERESAPLMGIAGNRLFRAYTALAVCTYSGHYLFLVGSPFLLIERHAIGVFWYGIMLSFGSVVHLAGTFACRNWLQQHSVRTTVAHAAVLTLAGGASMACLAWAGVMTPWAVVVPHWIYLFAHAVHQSCGQAAVMAPFPRSAGKAAALSGTVLPVVAVGLASLLAAPLGRSDLALPLGMGACALLTSVVAWTLVQRDGALPDEISAASEKNSP